MSSEARPETHSRLRIANEARSSAPQVLEVAGLRLRPCGTKSHTSSRFSFRGGFPVGPLGAALAFLLALAVTPPIAGQETPDRLPDLGSTGVVVPWEDFKKILADLQRPIPRPDVKPPVAFALTGCTATADVDATEQRARVVLELGVQVLEDQEWVAVPLLADGIALASATMDGEPARLFRNGGMHTVALRGAGRHLFVLEYLAPVQDVRGTRTARLRFPAAPVVSLDMVLPSSDIDVQVDGAVIRAITRTATTTRVAAALARAGDTTVSWFPRIESDTSDSKVFGELATLLSVGEGVARGSSTATFTIHGGGSDRFTLEIPADLTVLGVDVHGLRSWQVSDPDTSGRRILTVELTYRATGSLSFSFSFEQPLGAEGGELILPDIALQDVLRERGFLAVAAATNVEITPRDDIQNAAPVDPTELPPALVAGSGQSILYGFKFLRHPVVVAVDVVKHRDVAVKRIMIESARLHTFLNREGKLVTSARYTVKNNRKQYLEVELPEGATLWGAYVEQQPVKAARREDGAILVPLRMTAMDASGGLRPFDLEVVYFQDDHGLSVLGRRTLTAPTLDVDVLEMVWNLDLPRDKRWWPVAGNLELDEAGNRLTVVGDMAYNLGQVGDTQRLRVTKRDGRQYLTDGVNETDLDEVRVWVAGKERRLASDEIGAVGGASGGEEKDASAPSRLVPIPDPTPDEPEPRAHRELTAQVGQNVGQGFVAFDQAAGGRALGVLPVRIPVPSDGVRLVFKGHLLTTNEAPRIGLRFIPASWHVPSLGAGWTFVLGFVVTLMLALVVSLGGPGAGRWVVGAVLVAALAAIYTASAHHHVALAVACIAALAVAVVAHQMRDRQPSDGGF